MALIGLSVAAAVTVGGTSVGVAQATTPPAAAATLSASPGQLVTIDAKTDPADAVDALKHYQDGTDRSFTPTTDPTSRRPRGARSPTSTATRRPASPGTHRPASQ